MNDIKTINEYKNEDENIKNKQKITRGTGKEAEKVIKRLNGFNSEGCNAKSQLDLLFSSSTTHQELLSIAEVLCLHTGLKLTRLDKRNKSVLIKWYQDNWNTVAPFLCKIQLLDDKFRPINLERQLAKGKKEKHG